MSTRNLKVRFDSIRVDKSESYGFWGEPGAGAEWVLTLTVNDSQRTWINNDVRDKKDYSIGWDFYANNVMDLSILTVRSSGYEHDGSSANDPLPSGEHTFGQQQNWGIGSQTLRVSDNRDFDYTLFYNVSLLQLMTVSSVSKQQAVSLVAERRKKRGYTAKLADAELLNIFINKAIQSGYQLLSMDQDVLNFEGPSSILTHLTERYPSFSAIHAARFGKSEGTGSRLAG